MLNGATFAVPNVPTGATVRITASDRVRDWLARTLSTTANAEGNPMANRVDFGGPIGAGFGLKPLSP